MRSRIAILLISLITSVPAFAAGHAFSDNFSVLTQATAIPAEAQNYAQTVLRQAERFRRELATEWLGEELPAGQGRTIINVRFSEEDSALTWPIDSPRRTCHMLYLSMTPEGAIGSSLKHEMVHVILATRFPHPSRLPAWLEEGIASRYDDPQRVQHRRELVLEYARTGEWPPVELLLNSPSISQGNFSTYATAESLVDFLLTRGDKRKLMEFATDVSAGSVLRALHQHYGFSSLGELENAWHEWVRQP